MTALTAYSALFDELDRAYTEQGRVDPATWFSIDEEMADNPALTPEEYAVLHRRVENRLRRSWGFFR